MICSTCQSEILGDAKFCNRCGASVRIVPAVRYAGFWLRVLAVFIDLILLAPAIELGKEICFLAVWQNSQRIVAAPPEDRTRAEDLATSLAMWRQVADFGTMVFFIGAPYYILTECSALQGTLGKRVLGLRVADLDGRRLRLGRASLRYAGRLVSAMPWQFGFVMAGFTSKKQALHDMLARTVVVVADKQAEAAAPDWSAPRPAACSACARPLPADAVYCSWCGGAALRPRPRLQYAGFGRAEAAAPDWSAPGPAACSACARPLPADAAYCSWCGGAAFRPRPRLQYAGFGRKAAALLLDWLILAVPLVLLLRLARPVSGRDLQALRQVTSDALTLAERQNLQTRCLFLSLGMFVSILLVSGIYTVLLESSACRPLWESGCWVCALLTRAAPG